MIHQMLDQASYMAHGYCLLWKPWLVALHSISDLLIFASYAAIPVAIWMFISKRPNIELRGLATMFALFILWCGLTHIIDVVTLWYPIYEVQGWVKAITAGISVSTACAIFPLIPRALAIPSPNELEIANESLGEEVRSHRATLKELQVVRDDLEQRVLDRTRDLEALSERFRLLFEFAPVAMLMVSEEGNIRQANTAARELFGYAANEVITGDIEQLLPEPMRSAHIDLRKGYAAAPKARLMGIGRDLYARKKSGQEFPIEIGLNPIELDGKPFVVTSVINISERKQREEQIRLLMREVNHRSKNMLGVVQAIARHTAAKSPDDFVARFSERVQALGNSQDLLIANDWHGVEIGELIKVQLGHFQDLIGIRIVLSGVSLRLSTTAAQTIGMVIHELATNAAKYGALSTMDGAVTLGWEKTAGPNGPVFAMTWTERNGPATQAPVHRGFGTTVLEPMVRMGLSADVTLDFAPQGLTWSLSSPADKVLDSSYF